MTEIKEAPYYQEDARTNNPAFQISQLVRCGADARRLLVPIHDWARLSCKSALAEELEQILLAWGEPTFKDRRRRACEILDELNDLWSAERSGVDSLELGERRLLLNALASAL